MTTLFGNGLAGLRMDRHDKRLRDIIDKQPGADRRTADRGRRDSDEDPESTGGIVIRRWVFTLLLSTLSGAGVFIWQASRQTTLSEARVAAIEHRVESIEKLIEEYERLRYQRERQITELQTQQKNLKETLDQARAEMNAKLDRLLYGQRDRR